MKMKPNQTLKDSVWFNMIYCKKETTLDMLIFNQKHLLADDEQAHTSSKPGLLPHQVSVEKDV